jgi:capsular exopolysaccharide synthesis family protein
MERKCVVVAVSDDRAAVQAYKILRTRVRRRMAQKHWRTVAVTSVTPGDGKTLTAVNLALALAQDDDSWVYLVDLDLLRPAVGLTLGLSFQRGLSDYLAGRCEVNDVICATEYERLAVVANATAVADSTEQLVSRRTLELLGALRADAPSRTIIIDLPPMLGSADVLAFAPHVDCILAVVSEGETSRESLASAREILSETNLLGTVLNRSTEADSVSYEY